MDFSFTPEQERFRHDIREFLSKELTPEIRKASNADEYGGFSKEFSKRVAKKGWIGLAWPKEYGGQGLGYIERLIYDEEMTLAYAPMAYHNTAERQMIPSIILFGTDEQKKEFIPSVARGECGFCIGYSEPEAGSDLAGLRTRAVRDGDDYVVNGSKIWTSQAHLQDYIWLAVRTNPDAPKHRGISVLIVDLKSPGITIRPLANMVGGESFNQVFFDSVRVPVRNRVGEEDKGWYVVANNLDFERAHMDRIYRYYPLFKDVVSYAKEVKVDGGSLWDKPIVRNALADLAIQFEVGRLLCYHVAWMLSKDQMPNKESSMSKVYGTEVNQHFAATAMKIMGLYGLLDKYADWAPLQGRISRAYLSSFSLTIAGGTSEIQRNVIAMRGLGLPRG